MNTLSKIAAAALTIGLAAAASTPAAIAGPFGNGYKVGPVGGGLNPKLPGGNVYYPGKIKTVTPGFKIPPVGGGPAKIPPYGKGYGKGYGNGYGYAAAGLVGAAIVGTAIAASRSNNYVEGECYHVRQRVWDDEIGGYVRIRRLVCD